ncbi:HpnL family protein [Pigmentiphaga soli]|uniref:HpnL family protein n=1 Tax=Pigmentiphaga soli TaxID=1007095 RepID=A0ABP8GW27_9BURK
MTRPAWLALTAGVALFAALLLWHGIGDIAATVAMAGWGIVLVSAFHLLPLLLDGAAIEVLFPRAWPAPAPRRRALRASLLARWAGESVNSLMPAGQLGGPVLMVRHLSQRGLRTADAAAVITVSTTMQTFAQIVFALLGIAVFVACRAGEAAGAGWAALRMPLALMLAVCAALLYGFYAAQRRGLFGRLTRLAGRLSKGPRWSAWLDRADAVDAAVHALYGQRRKVGRSFALSLAGWIVGVGEVWLALQSIGHPVGWAEALLLESLGQAIRGAAFAIPGSLGVQEGGYLLLAPLAGLPPDAALALSLIKRARELALGLPGLAYLHASERGWQRRRMAAAE